MVEETTDTTLLADAAQTSQNWYSEEYKDLVAQRGWQDPDGVLKSYSELDKSASGKVKLPTDESSAEEISAFYDKIRGVENADGYEIKDVPENVPRDENMEALVRKVAYEKGGQKQVIESVIKSYYEALSQSITEARIKGENALKAEWKDSYESNLEVAKRFAAEGGEEFVQWLEDSKQGDNPIVIKAFYTYGKKILNDTLIQGTQGGGDKKDAWQPAYPDSPEMYATDTSPEGEKARLWFTQRGHIY